MSITHISCKSTLLALLASLYQPTSGSIELDGQPLAQLRAGDFVPDTTPREFQLGTTFDGMFLFVDQSRLQLLRNYWL